MFFPDLKAFAAYIRVMAVGELMADTAGRGEVAKLFTKTAKEIIGDSGKLLDLAPSTQAERVSKGYSANEPLLLTGELQDSIDWQHESPRKTSIGSDLEKAVWHEFGTPHIPARPFLTTTGAEKNVEGFELYSATIGRFFGMGHGSMTVETERVD